MQAIMYNPVSGSFDQEIIWCVSDESQSYTCTMAPIIGEDCQTRPAARPKVAPDHEAHPTGGRRDRPARSRTVPRGVLERRRLLLRGGRGHLPTVPYTTPGEGISLGHDDQEIGDTIPEPVHVSEIQPASENDLLAVLRTPGGSRSV